MADDQTTGEPLGVSRRDFLRASGLAAAGMTLAPRLIVAEKSGVTNTLGAKSIQRPGRIPKGSIPHRQFWLDEAGPAGARSIHHVYAPVEKVKCRFEDGGAALPNATISDLIVLEDGSYRAYVTVYSVDEKTMRVGIWESGDAVNWSARRLGQAQVDGRDTNLIQFDNLPGDQSSVAWPQVMRLPDGRWRMYFWKHRDGHLRYLIADSKDGLRWRVRDVNKPALYHPADGGLWKLAEGLDVHEAVKLDLPPEQVLARKRLWSNDSANVYYNDQLGRFECYSVWLHPAIASRRVDVDNAPGVHRLIQRRLSADGIDWSDPELVMLPDGRDPWDLQFYFLGVQWIEDFMVGSVGYYRVEDGQQTMDTDLCFSRDGREWQRPIRGGWIPRSTSDSGSVGVAGIYAWNRWLDTGDKWMSLYTATPKPHNTKVFETEIMGATFGKNRFVGLAAGPTPGGFMTEPFFPSQTDIVLDANVRGWLRAELCNGFGEKLPGFHLMDSEPMRGDSGSHVLRWKSAAAADHRFECVRLRFEFVDAEVYSVAF